MDTILEGPTEIDPVSILHELISHSQAITANERASNDPPIDIVNKGNSSSTEASITNKGDATQANISSEKGSNLPVFQQLRWSDENGRGTAPPPDSTPVSEGDDSFGMPNVANFKILDSDNQIALLERTPIAR